MAIEHQSISTQGVHRTSSDLIVQIVDGIWVVNIHHDFDIRWTLWDANEWVGFLSQMLDGLVFGFPPKIIQRDGLVQRVIGSLHPETASLSGDLDNTQVPSQAPVVQVGGWTGEIQVGQYKF